MTFLVSLESLRGSTNVRFNPALKEKTLYFYCIRFRIYKNEFCLEVMPVKFKPLFLLFVFAPFWLCAIDPCWSVQSGIGYRKDRFDWTVKDHGISLPGAKTNLKLDNQDIFQITFNAQACPCPWLYLRLDADYGWICHGSDHERFSFDSDLVFTDNSYISSSYSSDSYISSSYSSGERIVELKSHTPLEGQWVADGDAGIGIPFCFCWTPLEVIPMAGFSYNTQHITALNSSRIRKKIPKSLRKYVKHSHKHSRYQANWWGPWVGCDYQYNTYEFWNLYGGFEYHFAHCDRKRSSSIGLPFIDGFKKSGHAWGTVVKWGTRYFFECNIIASVDMCFQYFASKHRSENLSWRSLAMAVNIGYGF